MDIVKIIYSKKFNSFKNISKTICYFRIYRFLKKHLYVKSRGTHIGQKIPVNAFNLAELFLHEIIKKRNRYNYDLSNILIVMKLLSHWIIHTYFLWLKKVKKL